MEIQPLIKSCELPCHADKSGFRWHNGQSVYRYDEGFITRTRCWLGEQGCKWLQASFLQTCNKIYESVKLVGICFVNISTILRTIVIVTIPNCVTRACKHSNIHMWWAAPLPRAKCSTTSETIQTEDTSDPFQEQGVDTATADTLLPCWTKGNVIFVE